MATTAAVSTDIYIYIFWSAITQAEGYDGVVAGEALGVVSGYLQGPLFLVIRQVRPGLLGRGHPYSQSRW